MSEIAVLKNDDISEVAEMVFASEIGRKYYPVKSVLENLLTKGIESDRIYKMIYDGKIIGLLWFVESGAFYMYPYLHLIFVKEGYRNLGIGKQMLDYFEYCALNSSDTKKLRTKVFLVVGDWNNGAERFYKRSGYEPVGTLPKLFRKNINELLMMKECVAQK